MPTDRTTQAGRRAPEEVHRRNLSGLLRRVHLGGPLSRTAVAEGMHLNRSTIMALTAELTDAGLIYEDVPTGTGKTGRPSFVIRPASTRVYVLAFDVAVDRLVAARVALGGAVLERREAPRPRAGFDLQSVVDVLVRFGRDLLLDPSAGSICVGVAASYCGMIRPGDGVVGFGPDLGWVDQAFGRRWADNSTSDCRSRWATRRTWERVRSMSVGRGSAFRT